MSNSLWPHGLQHTRLPCPSLTPRACSNSYSLSGWYNPTILPSDIPFSSSHPLLSLLLPLIFPSIRVFLHIIWPKYWSFSFSISHSNEYSGMISFRIDWLDLLAAQGTLKSFPTPQFKSISSLALIFSCGPALTSILGYWKTIALTRWTFVGKVMSLLFDRLSRFFTAFLPRRKHLLVSWLPSPSAVILELKKRKSLTDPIVSLCIYHEVMGLDAMIFVFWMLSFKPAFSLSCFTFLPPLHFLP